MFIHVLVVLIGGTLIISALALTLFESDPKKVNGFPNIVTFCCLFLIGCAAVTWALSF